MSSAYDSAVVDTALIEDERLLTLPRGVRLLHLEALVWSKARLTDGEIPRGALRRMTDEDDPETAADQLVASGMWEATPKGWTIDYRGQMDRERVERRIESARKARDNYETRHPNRPRRAGTDTSPDTSRDRPALPPSRPPARGKGGGAGDQGAMRAPVALVFSECDHCHREFSGAGYSSGGSAFCSQRCELASKPAGDAA